MINASHQYALFYHEKLDYLLNEWHSDYHNITIHPFSKLNCSSKPFKQITLTSFTALLTIVYFAFVMENVIVYLQQMSLLVNQINK